MWLWWLFSIALARDVTTERSTAPEAAYVVLTAAETHCPVTVIVDPAGRPLDARPEGCAPVLHDDIVDAALRWRWQRGPEITTESIRVRVKRPPFSPRSTPASCAAALAVFEDHVNSYFHPPERCRVGNLQFRIPAPPFKERTDTQWCRVDVDLSTDGRTIEVGACADGYAEAAEATVSAADFPEGRVRAWRIWLGFIQE